MSSTQASNLGAVATILPVTPWRLPITSPVDFSLLNISQVPPLLSISTTTAWIQALTLSPLSTFSPVSNHLNKNRSCHSHPEYTGSLTPQLALDKHYSRNRWNRNIEVLRPFQCFNGVNNAEYMQLMWSYECLGMWWLYPWMTSIIVLRKGCTFGLPGLHSWKGLLAHTTGCLPASMLSSSCPSLKRLEKMNYFHSSSYR